MCCCGSNLSSCAKLKWMWSLLSGAKLTAVLFTSGQYFLTKNGHSLCCCPSSSYLVHHLKDYPHRLKIPLFRDVNCGWVTHVVPWYNLEKTRCESPLHRLPLAHGNLSTTVGCAHEISLSMHARLGIPAQSWPICLEVNKAILHRITTDHWTFAHLWVMWCLGTVDNIFRLPCFPVSSTAKTSCSPWD